MANPRPTWQELHEAGYGPPLPLTSGQRVQLVSGVLPSGEGGYVDFAQQGSGINASFNYDSSGILLTYPPASGHPVDSGRESGIFHFNELLSQFSNASEIKVDQIEDFTIFNPYVHHETLPTTYDLEYRDPIEIPYISTYDLVIEFNPYNSGIWTGFGSIPINSLLP